MPYVGMGALLPGWAGRKKFRPSQLFVTGAPGAWYDPSDLSSMYQDSAGTTPAAVGSPVGLRLDKRLGLVRGAEVANGSNFTGWVNLAGLLWDTFTVGAASLTLANATEKVTVAHHPDTIACVAGSWYEMVVNVTRNSGTYDISIRAAGGGTQIATTAAMAVGGDIPLKWLAPTTESVVVQITSRAGSGAQNLVINSASVKALPGNHASQSTSTSRSILQQDAGGRYYLLRDGVDDGEATGNIDFTGTDKVTVFAAVTKNSDAATGIIVELTANAVATNGGFYLSASESAAANFGVATRGTTSSAVQRGTTFTAPISAVLAAQLDNAAATIATQAQIRVNGLTPTLAQVLGPTSAGAFGIAKLNMGRRDVTGTPSLPFNGRDYGLIVLGRAATASEIARTERWLGTRAGIAL